MHVYQILVYMNIFESFTIFVLKSYVFPTSKIHANYVEQKRNTAYGSLVFIKSTYRNMYKSCYLCMS